MAKQVVRPSIPVLLNLLISEIDREIPVWDGDQGSVEALQDIRSELIDCRDRVLPDVGEE